MNVNLDMDISNILFLEHMKKKGNDNGEFNLLLVGEQGRNKPISDIEFDFSRKYTRPPLSKFF